MQIYNSLGREKETFEALKGSKVGMYVCGPTVYDEPHIGHARSAYIFDVMRRYFKYNKGYKVKFVRNVTDVDDKIIDKAKEEFKGENLNSAVKKVAAKYLSAYYEALDQLGITARGPDIIEPKASEYIDRIKEFIKILIEKRAAYQSGADVYFDITKTKNYGKLSNQSIEAMEAGARVTPTENKRNPLDFALWKSAKEGEPSWDSDWGKGRPGWHIECSVMSTDILGDEFDIHGGGLDLIFPHHENEIAQAEGAGKKFARFWIHHGLLTINGRKMAKSLGNFISVGEFLKKYHPDVLKLFFLSAHYRSPIDYNEERIQEAKKNYNRFQIFFRRLDEELSKEKTVTKRIKPNKDIIKFKKHFEEAMDDDFNTPEALAVLFDLVNFCNKLLDDYDEKYRDILRGVQDILGDYIRIFGITFEKSVDIKSDFRMVKIKSLVKSREDLRKKGNFAEADRIRKELEEKGIILEDTKEGTEWRRKI